MGTDLHLGPSALLLLGLCACAGASEQNRAQTSAPQPELHPGELSHDPTVPKLTSIEGRSSGTSNADSGESAVLDTKATTLASTTGETATDPAAILPLPASSSSIGSPTNGRLEGGVALPLSAPGLRYNDRRSENARFGTVETIGAILRAAAVVSRELPGSELVVNDIGLERGGAIAHHGSHRSGRDADILFYLLGDDGKPTPSVGAPLDPDTG